MTAILKWLGGPAMALSILALSLSAAGSTARVADAAEGRDPSSIRTLLAQHADVNAPQVDGMTALHLHI